MLKKNLLFLLLCSGIIACNSVESNKGVSSETSVTDSLHWNGQYEGTLPCADCPGIITVLNLKADSTFTMYNKYIDRAVEMNDKGSITWLNNDSVLHLKGATTDIKYKINGAVLVQLDLDGNELEGPLKGAFNLTKHSSH